MIPKNSGDLKNDFVIEELPTNTFKLNGKKIYGYADQLEAMKQAIYLTLNIERYENLIYSWNYGVELTDLFGQPIPFVLPEIERRVREALMQDSRITSVANFDFDVQKNKVLCKFKVVTLFGEIESEKVVNV